jgi:hypothetical protein
MWQITRPIPVSHQEGNRWKRVREQKRAKSDIGAHGLKDHRLGEMAGQRDPLPDREGPSPALWAPNLYACHAGTVLAVKQ